MPEFNAKMDMPDLFRSPDAGDWVYLNNAASTKPLPMLLDGNDAIWEWAYLNPSASGQASAVLKRAIRKQTGRFLKAIQASGNELIWTSGGTEANNLAIFGSRPANGSWVGCDVITTVAEHPSISQALSRIGDAGARVIPVGIDAEGQIDVDAFAAALGPQTYLVSIGLVHGETGVIQNLCKLRHLMDEHAPQALLHVDAVQGLTKTELSWDTAKVDFMSFSGHKIHAFGGVGALLKRHGRSLEPMIVGGGQQENLRSGSLDGAGILSFLLAANNLRAEAAEYQERICRFNRTLRDGLATLTTKDGTPVNPHIVSPETAVPFILNAALPGYEGAVVMRILDSMKITISTGSACSAESGDPSKVLTMMGLERRLAFGAIRISLGYYTTDNDISRFLSALQDALNSY